MLIKTERLILRPWEENDAESLYEYAKNPAVGPIAGWPVHTSVENSLEIIQTVLSAKDTFAVCLKADYKAIGSIGLMPPAQSQMEVNDTEIEVGYWIGVPFWGNGYIPEAVRALQKYAFEELGCTAMWCGYYDGNEKSRRCQEKCGFTYHHTEENKPCALMGDVRTEHFTYLSKEKWITQRKEYLQMNVNYEKKPAITFIGYHTEIHPNEGYQKCPEFWDREYAAKYARLWQTMKPETEIEKAILENGIGMYAICSESTNGFDYWIAGLYQGGNVPDGLELFNFPESDWAIFTAKGSIPQSLQTLNTQVWKEWAPNIRQMYEIGGSSLEIYSAGNPQSPDYECGIWVPIKKKADLKICQSCGMPMESEDVFGTNADGSFNEE